MYTCLFCVLLTLLVCFFLQDYEISKKINEDLVEVAHMFFHMFFVLEYFCVQETANLKTALQQVSCNAK